MSRHSKYTDHLGNVRAVIAKETGTANAAALVHATDYYPGGMVMPGRRIVNGEQYRYGYQGEYAETDPETGKPAFQLRLYDPRIGRWLTTDPKGEFASPYLAMGNSWANTVDLDGGSTDDCCPDYEGGELPSFSLSLKGGGELKMAGFDMNMYGRTGNMWNQVDWQQVYQPQIDNMIANMQRMQKDFLIEFGNYLSAVNPWSFAIGGAISVSANIGKFGFTRFAAKGIPQFKWLRGTSGKINGFSISKGSGYGAKPRFDFHKLSNTYKSRATSRMTIPKWLDGKKLPHWHRGKGNNLRYHRPWEIGPDGKRRW